MLYAPISIRLSKEQHPVVPSVADTKNGYNPLAISASIASLMVLPRKLQVSSGSRIRIFTNPIIAAFSTQEWASFEQYAINYGEMKITHNRVQLFPDFVDSF